MTQEQIIEGNKLIANFMGYEFKDDAKSLYPDGAFYKPNSKPEDFPEFTMSMIMFHSYWSWLMPVGEKIFLMREVRDFVIRFGETKIFLNNGDVILSPHDSGNTAIEELWLAIIEFITWYNIQSK